VAKKPKGTTAMKKNMLPMTCMAASVPQILFWTSWLCMAANVPLIHTWRSPEQRPHPP
jgi:hypothetical protein